MQVEASMLSSLAHLQTSYVDAYVLHGPSVGGPSLAAADFEVWRAMEALHRKGDARALGIGNVRAPTNQFQ
jgi:diketogulonate reductase-like aldo/keto reductase